MNFYIIYYPLYMLIMHVHHNSGRISWLRLDDVAPVVCPTSVAPPDSGHASRLRSMSMPHVLPPQLWNTSHDRARWLQHLIAQTLSLRQTGWDAWLIQRSKPQHLTTSHFQVSGHVSHDQQTLSPAWSERNPSIQKDLVPLQLGRIKVFEYLVRWAKALCRTTIALRTDHTWEKFLA
jgi:hypothetical protein